MKPTLKEIKDYLGVTDDDSDAMIGGLCLAAQMHLKGSVHPDYDTQDPRAVTLIQMMVFDMYTNRGLHDDLKLSANVRRLVDDFSLQMRLEMRDSDGS